MTSVTNAGNIKVNIARVERGVGPANTAVDFGNTLGGAVRFPVDATKTVSKISKATLNAYRGLKLASIVAAPFVAYGLVKGTIGLVKGGDRLTSALEVTSNVSAALDISSTFAEGLQAVGAVTEAAVAWSGPVLGVSAILSIASIALSSIGLHKAYKFEKGINGALDGKKKGFDAKDYTKLLKHLTTLSNGTIRGNLGIKGEKLKPRLEAIRKNLHSANEAERTAAETKMEKVTKTLKGRVKSKIHSHRMSIAAGIIAILAVAIFLFAAPVFAWIGFALMTVCCVMSIAKFIQDQVAAKRFKKALMVD